MSFKLKIMPLASRDIDDAYGYISERNPEAAIRWLDEMQNEIRSLKEFPDKLTLAPESLDLDSGEILQLVVGRRSGRYRVLYWIRGDTVEVLRVRHGRQERFTPKDMNESFGDAE